MRSQYVWGLLLSLASSLSCGSDCLGIALSGYCGDTLGEGMSLLEMPKQKLLLNPDGVPVLTIPSTTYIRHFSEGRAALQAPDGRWGYINKQGHWLLQPIWFAVEPFASQRALVQSQEGAPWQIIDTQGQVVGQLPAGASPKTPHWQGLATIKVASPPVLWSPGKTITLPAQTSLIAPPSEGFIAAKDLTTGKVGYLNTQGQWQLAATFDAATPFRQGLAAVQKEGQWVLIDPQGQILKSLPGQQIVAWGEATRPLWWVQYGPEHFGYLQLDGSSPYAAGIDPQKLAQQLPAAQQSQYRVIAIPPLAPGEPIAFLSPIQEKQPVGLVLANGQIQWPAGLRLGQDQVLAQKEMPFVVETDSGWGALDANGHWVVPARFKSLNSFKHGVSAGTQHETEALIEANGKIWFPPGEMEWEHVHDDLAVFKQKYQYGVMRIRTGEILLPATDAYIGYPTQGIVYRHDKETKQDGLWLLAEKRWLVPPVCQDIDLVTSQGPWLCRIQRNKWELLTQQGQRIPLDTAPEDISGGYQFHSQGKYGLIRPEGTIIWPEIEGPFTAWDTGDTNPWWETKNKEHFAIIDTAGHIVHELRQDILSLYRLHQEPNTLLFAMNDRHTGFMDIRSKQITLSALPAPEENLFKMGPVIVHWQNARAPIATTSVDLGDGQKHTQPGLWYPVSNQALARSNPDLDDTQPQPLWWPAQDKQKTTPYSEIRNAGHADWLLVKDSKTNRWSYVDAALNRLFGEATWASPYEDGVAWISNDDHLILQDKQGRALGALYTRCPASTITWTVAPVRSRVCKKK